jgi:hypothetical protein
MVVCALIFYLQSVKVLLLYTLYNLFFNINFYLILTYVTLVVGPLRRLYGALLFSDVCVRSVGVFNVILSGFNSETEGVLLSGVNFMQSLKHGVVCVGIYIIHM